MNTLSILAIFLIFAFSGIVYAYAEDSIPNVIINEVDTNPPGDDMKSISEWVELYNPTDHDIDIGGWKIASTTATKKTLIIPTDSIIKPGQFVVYSYTHLWFADVSEKVQLKDKSGKIIDETLIMADQKNDFSSWQRKYDGLDTNASNDWTFRMSSVGSSNGVTETTSADGGQATVSVNVDKHSYIFDETAVITGNVSKRISQEKPFFSQQQLIITIDGPGSFYKTITMYPDLNLKFKTSIKLDKAQGVTEGTYDVTVSYGGEYDSMLFSVGDEIAVNPNEAISELSIMADKSAYIPGQTVLLSASTTKVIPSEGLKFSVYNPKGNQIYTGNLFPTKDAFSTTVFMTTVNPVYGTYRVVADYGTQHSETAFELVQDVKNIEQITLVTDKKYYGLGESITIYGRSSKHVVALDLEVLQTGAPSGKETKNVFKLTDQISVKGDGTFEYKVSSPTLTLGDYRVTVSKEFGKSVAYFNIVEDPTAYSETENKNFVSTEQATYDVGDKLVILGHVIPQTRSTFEAIPVYVTISTENGKPLTFIGQGKTAGKPSTDPQIKSYSFSAVPDIAGNYKIDATITKSVFLPGNYIITATYGGKETSTMFTVIDSLDVTNKKLIAKTDKSVYGLGEIVKLDGSITTGQSAVQIVLTKPGGKTMSGGSKVENNKFSWTWQIPQKDFDLITDPNYRGEKLTVFGTYNISIKTSSETLDVFFKVSKDPENDTLSMTPLEVTTDKPVYRAGEKLVISGSAIKRQLTTGSEGITLDRVNVQVKTSANKLIYNSELYFDNGGNFKTTQDHPLTIFKDGTYKVTATYKKLVMQTTFEVKNNIPINADEKLTLYLNTDKEEYSPGDTIHISGSLNKVIFLDQLNLVVLLEDEDKINCGTSYCGLGGKQIDLSKYYDSGIYNYDYVIPQSAPLGNYVVKVDAQFGTFTKTFKVVEKKITQIETEPKKISEKFNRITDSSIQIPLVEKTIQDQAALPKVLQGSLVVKRDDVSKVNIRLLTESGQCVIGQTSNCLVSKSTRTLNSDYSIVQIDGTGFKVQYSGPGPILEKFTIMPEFDLNTIQDSVWTVDIVKEQDQYSKFYYEITYVSAQ
ncbi:MAG: lamin tail domain-containing protein [Thaumarchaeota archaeon]|nr:lamin tail domain-containing protein [Nitrososphaerota archaeon]